MSSSDNPEFEAHSPLSVEPPLPALTPTSLSSNPFATDVLSPLPVPPSPRDPVWSGWDVLQIAGLALLLTLFLVPLLVVTGARLLVYTHESWLEVASKPVLALLSQFLAYMVVGWCMVLLVKGKYYARFWQAIRWNWPGPVRKWLWLALGLVMLFALGLLERFLPTPKSTPFEQFFARPIDAYLTSIFAVTIGPLMEELFFRGFLYPVLNRRLGLVAAVFLTALPFGLMHLPQYGYSWGAGLVVFLVGVVLTAVRAASKSVGASFLVHVGYNGTLMIGAALVTDGFRHMDKVGLWLF